MEEKKHSAHGGLTAAVIILGLCLLVCILFIGSIFMNNDGKDDISASISEINADIVSLQDKLDKMTAYITEETSPSLKLYFEKLNADLTVMKNSIDSVEVSIDDSDTSALAAVVNEFDISLNELFTQLDKIYEVESDMLAETENSISEIVSIVSEMNLLIDDYHEIGRKMREQLELEIIEGAKAFNIASDTSLDDDTRSIYYINAINHDSKNIEYYDAFFDFIKHSADTESNLTMFMELVGSSVYYASPDCTEHLVSLLNEADAMLNGIINDSIIEVSHEEEMKSLDELIVTLDNVYASSTVPKYDVFNDLYNSFNDSFVVLNSDESVPYIESLMILQEMKQYFDIYAGAKATVGYILDIDSRYDSDLYLSVVESSLPSVVDALKILSMREKPLADNKENSLITLMFSDLEDDYDSIVSDYDGIILDSVLKKVSDLRSDIRTVNYGYYDKCNDELTDITNLASLSMKRISGKFHIEKISAINQLIGDCSKELTEYNLRNYQIWAAKKIQKIKEVLKDAEKGDKLRLLYAHGFYDIDRKLLVPNLAVLYDDINDESYIKHSDLPIENILKAYPVNVVQLGDYTEMGLYI